MGSHTKMPGRDKVCEESHSGYGGGRGGGGGPGQRGRGDKAGVGSALCQPHVPPAGVAARPGFGLSPIFPGMPGFRPWALCCSSDPILPLPCFISRPGGLSQAQSESITSNYTTLGSPLFFSFSLTRPGSVSFSKTPYSRWGKLRFVGCQGLAQGHTGSEAEPGLPAPKPRTRPLSGEAYAAGRAWGTPRSITLTAPCLAGAGAGAGAGGLGVGGKSERRRGPTSPLQARP